MASTKATVLATASDVLLALHGIAAWADDLCIAYAWITSSHGHAEHWQAIDLAKVSRAVVGIHFAQTEPWALRQLARREGVLKVVADTAGVYHPKTVLGVRKGRAKAIIGSSNFTGGGFGGNTELNVMLEGPAGKGPLRSVATFINDQWHGARAFVPDEDWLAEYEQTYKRRPRPPRTPKRKTPGKKLLPPKVAADLDIGWLDYYKYVADQDGRVLANNEWRIRVFDHPDGSYLQAVDAFRAAFKKYPRFREIPVAQRRMVSGWGDDRISGHFGNMKGAGVFKNIVLERPALLGRYLDAIPLQGPVARQRAEKYFNGMVGLKGVNLGAATRLLTCKRPDLFLSVNDANKKTLKKIFGKAPSSISSYLDLVERLQSLPWFRSKKPKGRGRDEQRVWAARVGLLDAILYEIPARRL